jgi:hypothetical protein
MNPSTWFWRLLIAMTLGLCLTTPSVADDKDKKDAGKSKDSKAVIVIQIDASKLPPDVLKKLMELSRNTAGDKRGEDDDKKGEKGRRGDDDDKKGEKGRRGDDDDKKGETGRRGDDDDKKGEKGRRGDDDDKKGEKGRRGDDDDKKGKPNIVQVDLNKLSPELAKRLKEELAKSKGGR